MLKGKKILFGKYLINHRLVTERQLTEALSKQATSSGHRRVGEILIRLGYINQDKIFLALARHLGFGVNFKLKSKDLGVLPKKLTGNIDSLLNICRLYRCVPLFWNRRVLTVVVDRVFFSSFQENLERSLGVKICFVFTTTRVLEELFEARFNTLIKPGLETPHPFHYSLF